MSEICKSSRSADQRRNIDVGFFVDGKNRRDDLRVVQIAFREKRANRAVDHTSGKRRFLSRATFALVEAARNFSGSVEFFGEFDGQREKTLSRLGFFCGTRGDEHAGVAVADENGAVSLFCEFACFDGQRLAAHFA